MTLAESVLEDEGMHVFEWWGGKIFMCGNLTEQTVVDAPAF